MQRRAFLGATISGLTAGAFSSSIIPPSNQSEPYSPLGEIEIDGTKEVVVSADGRTAFLAVTDGFAVVDLSEPTDPTLLAVDRAVLADHEQGPLRQIWDVSYDAGELVVASQGGANGALFVFAVYDVSDPANPRFRLAREVDGPIHNCELHRGHVYLTGLHRDHHGGDVSEARLPLEIYDVRTTPARLVADWSPLDDEEAWARVPAGNRVIHDVSVVGDRAYLAYWDAGAFVLDVREPSEPSLLSRVGDFEPAELASMSREELAAERTESPEGNAHYVSASPDGDLLAVGKEGWDDPATDGGGPGGIDLYDATDPTAPFYRATIDPEPAPDETRDGVWTTAHNFEIRGDRLYSAWYRAGVKVHDVSTPAEPELLAWWLAPRELSFWTAQVGVGVAGEFFVASSARDGSDRLHASREALLTFPDRAGEQANRPDLARVFDARATATRQDSTGTNTSTTIDPDRSPVDPNHPGAGEPPGTLAPESATVSGRTTATTAPEPIVPGGAPGYGALAALGGLGIGAYRYLRNR